MHSTNNLEDGYMGSGKRLRYSIRKYGIENHKKDILEFFENRNLLVEAEKIAITPEMLSDKDCMNLKEGGCGGWVNSEHQLKAAKSGAKKINDRFLTDVEFNERLKKIRRDVLNNTREEYKKSGIKFGCDWKGRKHSEETREKMRKPKNIGNCNSQYGTCWITKNDTNKKIKKDDLNTYIKDGWVLGRKI